MPHICVDAQTWVGIVDFRKGEQLLLLRRLLLILRLPLLRLRRRQLFRRGFLDARHELLHLLELSGLKTVILLR